MSEDRQKIAVFVDFDNIEIGVRNTLNRNFDISAVLEAVKERGEIVTKVAYGDWKRSGEYGRAMGQHAIHMVQRNPTPGGDKNGADINLALDALEMAFTRDHINSFVIVGGDSDFITLVEKLKQYDKKVIVVGGRGFTSAILQKNCHEFIAYENLIRSSSGRRQPGGRSRSGGEAPLEKAVPQLYRALKILTEREVSPQIGLLKSTLLQLDSTFSEKDYGASSFRDFVEKLARKGIIRLKHMDRSILVEPLEDGSGDMSEEAESDPASENGSPAEATAPAAPERGSASPERAPASPERMEEGASRIREAFEKAESIKWPMYMRSVKQLIRSFDSEFEESDYGFRGLQDALRHVQKSGWLRLDRNRRGVLRVLPGDALLEARGESAAPLGQREEPAAEKVSKRYTPEEEAAAQMAEAAKRSRQDEDEDSVEAVGDAAAEPEETRGPDEPAGDMPDGDDEASEETKPARKKAARKTTRKKAAATKTRARKTTGTRRKTAAKAPKAAKEADAE